MLNKHICNDKPSLHVIYGETILNCQHFVYTLNLKI